MILKKTRIFLLITLISANFLVSCKSEEKIYEFDDLPKKTGVGFDVFADKNGTKVKVSFEKSSKLTINQVKFNGKILKKAEERDGRIEYKDFFGGYQGNNQFIVNTSDGKELQFGIQLEPIDFPISESFLVHRLKATEIPISRTYTGKYPLSLVIFDNYIGGFKTEAEFNKDKTAIIISKADRQRISVGETKIRLVDVETKDLEEIEGNTILDGHFTVSYQSEIKIKVVK